MGTPFPNTIQVVNETLGAGLQGTYKHQIRREKYDEDTEMYLCEEKQTGLMSTVLDALSDDTHYLCLSWKPNKDKPTKDQSTRGTWELGRIPYNIRTGWGEFTSANT